MEVGFAIVPGKLLAPKCNPASEELRSWLGFPPLVSGELTGFLVSVRRVDHAHILEEEIGTQGSQ